MAEASTQMAGPETRRRQSAIAHLKAAVAATLAERRITGDKPRDEDGRLEPYRSDLAKAVPPGQTGAPSGPRPAPLVLVSEQRIDRPAPTPQAPAAQPVATVQPTRPMRTGSAAAAPAMIADLDDEDEDEVLDDDDDSSAGNIFGNYSFAEFADRLGATELGDMIEAAAAYIACVEGRDSFTRPQLLRYVAESQSDVQREDSLRSFGVLLREGRIEKSRRGQFALSESSAVLAEARKIAG